MKRKIRVVVIIVVHSIKSSGNYSCDQESMKRKIRL